MEKLGRGSLAMLLGTVWLVACGGGGDEEDADAGTDAADVGSDVEPEADASGEDGGAEDAVGPEDAPADLPDGELPCPAPDATYDEADPGVHVLFTVAEVRMMGQRIDTAIGAFLPAAREDFRPEAPPHIAIDTCVEGTGETTDRECTTDADCAPEQRCVPEEDASGNPIPDTGVCETERAPLDVGPFACDGFVGGPLTFQYNPGQNGAYTATADGTLDPAVMAYDTTYEFSGDGDPAQGLGRFAGSLPLPGALEITAPATVIGPMGFPILEIDGAAELALEWSGGDGESPLTLTMSGTAGTITCRVTDDGAFTIPAEMVAFVGLGDIAFFNVFEARRERTGEVCGAGVTDGEVTSVVSTLLNVRRAAEPTPEP